VVGGTARRRVLEAAVTDRGEELIRNILGASGWNAVDIKPIDLRCMLPVDEPISRS
jgi:hypothetical protein